MTTIEDVEELINRVIELGHLPDKVYMNTNTLLSVQESIKELPLKPNENAFMGPRCGMQITSPISASLSLLIDDSLDDDCMVIYWRNAENDVENSMTVPPWPDDVLE